MRAAGESTSPARSFLLLDSRREDTRMANTNDGRPETTTEARPATPELAPVEAGHDSAAASTARTAHPDHSTALTTSPSPETPPRPSEVKPTAHSLRKWLLLAGLAVGLAVGMYFLVPWVVTALNTVSTDDAYVNGHVTLVAPRVRGQVVRVLIDDNYRVKK